MRIRLLCENEASGMYWKAEWGFSAFIEYRGSNILFDMGFSDIWRHNADLAEIDLQVIDTVAFSHIHRDHTRGVLNHGFKDCKTAYLHPRVMAPAPEIEGDDQAGDDYRAIQDMLRQDFKVIETTQPAEMAPGAWFLGEIPRVTDFEKGVFFDDPMPDDTALAFETDKGAVVVTGCSHAGICNICEAAKAVTGQPLHAVIGGFHLLHDEDPPVDQTIAWFKKADIKILLPMHCVEFDILARFHSELGTRKLGAGDVIEL